MRTFHDAKLMAKALREALADRGSELPHSAALEIVARQFGFDNWNVLAAKIEGADNFSKKPGPIVFQPAIPIFRIFSVEKAFEFYKDFLGFNLDWDHRFGDNFPLYCQISRNGTTLHLSEHAGDASPGAKTIVHMTGIDEFHAELTAKEYRYMKPGIKTQPWGRELVVTDPFSNRITFCQK